MCAFSLGVCGTFFILGFAFLALTNWSNNRYYQEITQNMNKSLAMYITQREPLIIKGVVNENAMKELAGLVMIVNPIVEVYLLDNTGKIISHAAPKETVIRTHISTAPIHQLLSGKKPFPITGEDPRSLTSERVLANLIDNAIRYTPSGGNIQVSLAQQQDKVEVGIKDSGIGLTEEDIPHIFERYYRGQKPTEYQQQSTGLGLAIVKRILELHNSVIRVESHLNQGTYFTFPLPTKSSIDTPKIAA